MHIKAVLAATTPAVSTPPWAAAHASRSQEPATTVRPTDPLVLANPRAHDRKTIGFDTLTELGLTHSVPWHIVNLGMDGAYAEMDTSDLKPGKSIEFLVRGKLDKRWIELRFQAEVTRVERCGAAFRFGAYDETTRLALSELLAWLP